MKSQVDVWCWISPRFPRLLLEGPLLVYSHVILKAELQIWANCMAKINMTRMTRLVESFLVLNCKRCFVHFSFIKHALWFSETYMYEYNSLHIQVVVIWLCMYEAMHLVYDENHQIASMNQLCWGAVYRWTCSIRTHVCVSVYVYIYISISFSYQ